MALTIEILKNVHHLTDDQLDRQLSDRDLFYIADFFDGWSQYVETPGLGLSRGEKAQIAEDPALKSNTSKMKEALKIWRSFNPYTATFRNLLIMLLSLNTQGDVAQDVCLYLNPGGDGAGFEQTPAVTPLSVTENPSSKDSTDGESVTFSVVATGTSALNYQWRVRFAPNPAHDINDRDSRGKYSGAHTNVLTVGNLTQADNGHYSVVVTNQVSSVTSREAQLKVARPPNVHQLNHAQLADQAATVDQVHCMKVCGCITVLVATLAVIVRVYGLPGGDANTVVHSSQLKMKLTGTIIHPDDYPTLPTMLNFTLRTGVTINIINMIAGKNFKQFGAHVLNDDQGIAVNIIVVRHHHDPVAIVTEILTDWLAGMGKRPPTWRTLVKCLRTTTLHGLADQLEGQYI